MRRLLAALPLLLCLACGNACEDLAARICNCEPAGAAREACKNSAARQIDSGSPKPGGREHDLCERKLDTCSDSDGLLCERLKTEAGKIACGLSPDPAAAAQ